MKIALITDTHWGCRGDSIQFADYFKKFYDNVFFPTLKEQGIKTIIHLGDIVDRRKYINFVSAKRLREDFMYPAASQGIHVHVILGNHDVYYKNTNEVNAMTELYSADTFVNYYSSPTELNFGGEKIMLMPWINSGNYQESMQAIENTKAQILFGHLELKGFEMYKGSPNDHGFDASIFNKFDVVCSGHFHHKSSRGNIHYLGSPYEITWSDYNDPRGFHIFDTDDRSLTFIENPYKMFTKIHYDDEGKKAEDFTSVDFKPLANSFVKVIVRNKTNPYWFDLMMGEMEKAGVVDIQVVEDNYNLNLEDDSDIVDEAEDTVTILKKYVEQINLSVDKNKLDLLMRNLYNEAIALE